MIVANGSLHTIIYSIYWLREVVRIQLLSQSYALRKPGDEKKNKLPLKECWKFQTIVTATANQNKHLHHHKPMRIWSKKPGKLLRARETRVTTGDLSG